MAQNEFAEMLATFDRWIATQERDGWASPEVENYAGRVRKGLWACAKNNPTPKPLADGLAEDTEALAKALSASACTDQN